MIARDIMTPDVVTIRPEATIHDAIELLLDRGISGLPVTDREGRLIGILTEFALLAIAYDHAVCQHSVADHMTRDVLTVDVNEPVSRVADMCIVNRVRRVPVTENGRLVGLIARRDVLQAVFETQSALHV